MSDQIYYLLVWGEISNSHDHTCEWKRWVSSLHLGSMVPSSLWFCHNMELSLCPFSLYLCLFPLTHFWDSFLPNLIGTMCIYTRKWCVTWQWEICYKGKTMTIVKSDLIKFKTCLYCRWVSGMLPSFLIYTSIYVKINIFVLEILSHN